MKHSDLDDVRVYLQRCRLKNVERRTDDLHVGVLDFSTDHQCPSTFILGFLFFLCALLFNCFSHLQQFGFSFLF
jgi:hypothetical protein